MSRSSAATARASPPCSTPWPASGPVDAGTIIIDGQDVTRLPEHKRAKYIGRVFQDPMMGTAATMQIDENLALAARRG